MMNSSPEPNNHSISRKLLARGGVLLAAMVVAKIVLLAGASQSLYQDHWRWSATEKGFGAWTSFVVFCGLLFISFISVGRTARNAPPKHIRVLNVGFLLAGLMIFIFSLHNGESNCFEPMLDGLLPFKSVYSYWAVGLFFGPPWLAGYLLSYFLLYWILWRKKTEWRSFYVLGVMAAIYACLNFSWLTEDKRSLVAIDCFGFASLISAALNRQQRLNFAAQCLPLALMVAVWSLLGSCANAIASPAPYLMIVLSFTLLFFLLPAIPTRVSLISSRLSHWLPFFFSAFLLIANRWYRMSDNYNKLIVYSFSLPHYLFSETGLVVALCSLTWLLSRWMGRKVFWLFDPIAILLILLTAADVKLEREISNRLDWNLLTQCESVILLLRTVRPYWMECLAGLLIAVTYYVGAIFVTKRFLLNRSFARPSNCVRWSFVPAYMLLVGLCASATISAGKMEGFALTNIIGTSPWLAKNANTRLSPTEFQSLTTRLNLLHPAAKPGLEPDSGKKLNVLLVVLESTYNKYLSLFGSEDETEPLLQKYKDRMELFPNFYSAFPNSFHARFTVLSGLYPIREAVSHVNPHINATSLFELLHNQGYRNSVYQSDPREYLRFSDYLSNRGIDDHYDCNNMPGKEKFQMVSWGIPEQATMEAITNYVSTVAKGQKPFFISYFPVAPHMPYDSPLKGFQKFPSKIQPFIKRDYSGEYKNTLLYVDWVLTSMLDALEREHLLDETLVVITNDHGEMLGEEEGQLGHGWRLTPELCNTPLIILNPMRKGYRVNYTLGSQVDLLPTISSLLNIGLAPDEMYEGDSLYNAAANGGQKTVYLNSTSQRGLVRDGKFYVEESPGAEPRIYNISFQGTKTVFEKVQQKAEVVKQLNDFDLFQNSLIRNYYAYKKQGFAKMTVVTNTTTLHANLTE